MALLASRTAATVLLAAALAAGCAMNDSTTTFPTTTQTAAEPATSPPPGSGEPAPACPLGQGCPRDDITPGAVIPSQVGVCTRDYNPRGELNAVDKRRVLRAYGLTTTDKIAEWDHRIARWAGGASTIENIWPAVNAAEKQRKDRLEYGLYLRVCRDHTMLLDVARQQMREFWAHW